MEAEEVLDKIEPEWSDQTRDLFLNLAPDEKEFALLYLKRHEKGLTQAQIVHQVTGNRFSDSAASVKARAYIRKCYEFFCSAGESALGTLGSSLKSSVAYYLERSMTADEVLVELAGCELRDRESDSGEIDVLPWCESLEDIPKMWRKYISKLIVCVGGGYWIVTRELYDEKTRIKMRENLDKITGNTIERVEMLNVGANGEKVKITDADDLEAVFKVYRKAVRND